MKRVSIIGCPGAGKSTLASTLSEKNKLPLIQLDKLYWGPGWVAEDHKKFDQKLTKELSKSRWIIDGNFPRTMPKRFEKSDTIIWLDHATWRCLWRALKRLIQHYGQTTRQDLPEGCPESFDLQLLIDIIRHRRSSRPGTIRSIKKYARHCNILVFTKPTEVKAWLETLK